MRAALYRGAILILICAAVRCTLDSGGGDPPSDISVEPATGEEGEEVQVTIRGAGFNPTVTRTTSCGSRAHEVDDAFEADLDGTALTGVTWVDEATLSAVIPAGLAPGLHDMILIDPSGNSVEIPDAFEVISGSDGDTDGDTDTDTDSDGDTDTDADSDTDTEPDTDTFSSADYTCEDDTDSDADNCTFVCGDGGCSATCSSDEDCHLTCNSGDCDLLCLGPGACRLNCGGGGCSAYSYSASSLVVLCSGGDCHVWCGGTGICWLETSQDASAMTGCTPEECTDTDGLICNGDCADVSGL